MWREDLTCLFPLCIDQLKNCNQIVTHSEQTDLKYFMKIIKAMDVESEVNLST